MARHQIVTDRKGSPIAAVVPWDEYAASPLFEPASVPDEALSDEELFRRSVRDSQGQERIPFDVVRASMEGSPIKAYRKWRGLKQAELAARVGTNAHYISQIERGRRGGSTELLKRIAGALEVDLDMIVD